MANRHKFLILINKRIKKLIRWLSKEWPLLLIVAFNLACFGGILWAIFTFGTGALCVGSVLAFLIILCNLDGMKKVDETAPFHFKIAQRFSDAEFPAGQPRLENAKVYRVVKVRYNFFDGWRIYCDEHYDVPNSEVCLVWDNAIIFCREKYYCVIRHID